MNYVFQQEVEWLAKILCKKKVYEYKKDCIDEFGKYDWYFDIYLCLSKVGITWQIDTSDMTSNNKKLRDCLNDVLKHLEEDNPRYYRLKDKIFSKNLANKLW